MVLFVMIRFLKHFQLKHRYLKHFYLKHSYLKYCYAPAFLLCFITSTQAEHLNLSTVVMPDNTENIYVEKIASDANSTDFVIFIKKQVPLHKHLTHTETIYVLAGKGLFQQGDTKHEIGPGDYLRIPKNTPHAVTVISDEPLKVLSVQAPEFYGKDRVFIKTP